MRMMATTPLETAAKVTSIEYVQIDELRLSEYPGCAAIVGHSSQNGPERRKGGWNKGGTRLGNW